MWPDDGPGPVREFRHDGLRFPVLDRGPGTAGRVPVVLLHGFPQQPSSFDQVSAILNRQGLRTLVPGQRGYPDTARPTSRRCYGADRTAADVIALLDAARIPRAHLVGHDWGGAQAWTVAGRHPDRVAGLTVLSTPHPRALARALVTSRQALMSWYLALFQLPRLPEAFARRRLSAVLSGTGLPAQHVRASLAALTGTGADPAALTGAINWYRGMPFGGPAVGAVPVPTSYVWGRHDFALGRAAAELTGRHVTGPYRFVELDAGHWLPETRAEEVAEVVLAR